MAQHVERVGLILVHGVGEQKRFEHLDNQGRQIIRALKAAHGDLTVEIEAPDTAAFHAEQATWRAGGEGSVKLTVKRLGKPDCRIHLHEVWWADINERPSIAKQIRFWLWGLSVWVYRDDLNVPGLKNMQEHRPSPFSQIWDRLRLFGVGCIFTLGAIPLGPGLKMLQRLLALRATPLLPLIANYISAVKLFVQPHRDGSGIVRPGNEDFLDTLDEPPRVSVRRRMIRTIADVASQKYSRWYIVAHSQGTVAALNGLMERSEAWPGYLTEKEWENLRKFNFVLPLSHAMSIIPPSLPRPPLWNFKYERADRPKIFENFAGLITLGSPIEKFATIWPSRVPISKERAFSSSAFWVNVYDPLDAVSGVMTSFKTQAPQCCPVPQDIGYSTSPFLLVGHTRYLARCGGSFLADSIAELLVKGTTPDRKKIVGSFPYKSWRHSRRRISVWVEWLMLYVLLLALAAMTLHFFWKLIAATTHARRFLAATQAMHCKPPVLSRPTLRQFGAAAVGLSVIAPLLAGFLFWMIRIRPERTK